MLPSRCRVVSAPTAEDAADHVLVRWTVDCGPDGLAGDTLAVADLAAAKSNALLSVTRLDGEAVQTVLGPRRSSFDVPAHEGPLDVLRGYARLGVEHILSGPDHLLFVFGLLLLSRIPAFINGSLDAITIVSTIVEFGFLVWGILILRK